MPVALSYTDNQLGGVLNYLHTKYESQYWNLVTASDSSHIKDFYPSKAVDFKNDTIWHPNYPCTKLGEYVQFDLLHHFVILEAYTLQTSQVGETGAHPRDWAFSASYDNNTWSEPLRYIDEEGVMANSLRMITLPVDLAGKYKHFRITITGYPHGSYSDPRMDVNQIELFGVLYSDNEPLLKATYRCNMTLSSLLIYIFLLFKE